MNICTVILHPKGPLPAQWHQNPITRMRETYQKLAEKWPKNSHFSTFYDFLKNCPYDSNEILYSRFTPYYGPLCAISSNSYDWDSSESEGKRPKSTPLPLFLVLLVTICLVAELKLGY